MTATTDRKWPQAVTAAWLKRSAERSRWRKGTPFRSAMAMLPFYINRAGDKLDAKRREILEAKGALRVAVGRKGG